jgi:hypothetical protein
MDKLMKYRVNHRHSEQAGTDITYSLTKRYENRYQGSHFPDHRRKFSGGEIHPNPFTVVFKRNLVSPYRSSQLKTAYRKRSQCRCGYRKPEKANADLVMRTDRVNTQPERVLTSGRSQIAINLKEITGG